MYTFVYWEIINFLKWLQKKLTFLTIAKYFPFAVSNIISEVEDNLNVDEFIFLFYWKVGICILYDITHNVTMCRYTTNIGKL